LEKISIRIFLCFASAQIAAKKFCAIAVAVIAVISFQTIFIGKTTVFP
jgi:hypothetical protein